MTTKEINMKLARDIARINLIVDTYGAASDTVPRKTISDECIAVMRELDNEKENDLFNRVKGITEGTSSEEIKKSEAVFRIMTRSYIKAILLKLKIRSDFRSDGNGKQIKKFTPSDYGEAAAIHLKETTKAVEIISQAIQRNEPEVIINLSAIEAYGYETKRAKEAITQMLKDRGITAQDISIDFMAFASLNMDAIEHLEKTKYYNKWIYERFQPVGIVKVAIRNQEQSNN